MATDPIVTHPVLWEPLDAVAPTVPRRGGPREDTVRIVEYTAFPRRSAGDRPRYGFTRDVSDSGMCLGVDEAEDVGTLLRVSVRDVDGSPSQTSIVRVVWCSAERDGRHWLGLELISEGRGARQRGR